MCDGVREPIIRNLIGNPEHGQLFSNLKISNHYYHCGISLTFLRMAALSFFWWQKKQTPIVL